VLQIRPASSGGDVGVHSLNLGGLGHRWGNIGLQRRIMTYVVIGCLALLSFFWLVGHTTLEESTAVLLQERLYVALVAALKVDEAILDDPERATSAATLALQAFASPTDRFTLTWIANGRVLVSTAEIPSAYHIEHMALFLSESGAGGAAVRVHDLGGEHVVAYAPLALGPGGIVVHHQSDAIPALQRAFQRQMLWLGLGTVCAGLALAWTTTRRVVRPLEALTEMAQRIAHGDLERPVSISGQDETARLGAAFAMMRLQLQHSRAQLEAANRDLEARVAERTMQLEDRNAELDRVAQELRAQQEQRSFLLEKIIQAQEEERQRVARDLHDGVGQYLAAITFRLGGAQAVAANRHGSVPPAMEEFMNQLQDLSSRAVDDVRRLIVNLRPSLLDDMGLVAALGWYADQFLAKDGIMVDFQVEEMADRLPSAIELTVFRVLQEAITNVAKHASARHVKLRLSWQGSMLVGSAQDDGVGFSPERLWQPAHPGSTVGLLGMRERIRLLGGTFEVIPHPGVGTRIQFTVPVAPHGGEGKAG